jgi:hypothetical protein
MELTDCFYQADADPPMYTFVFDQTDEYKNRLMLRMPDNAQWMLGRFMMGEYHPGQANEHLGVRVLQHQLGRVVIERLITRLPY